MLEIRLLGRFEVRREGHPLAISSRPAQSLLAYLALNPGVHHRREQLAGLLAPDSPDESARAVLRHALWLLRKLLGADPQTGRDYLQADELTIAFDAAAHFWLDAAMVAAPIVPAPSTEQLIESVACYSGDLLPGFYDDWVVLARTRLEASFENRMRLLLERELAAQRFDDALEWAERWIALGHSPEAAYCALMIAHAAHGDRSREAAAYRRCVDDLRAGLGVEPSVTTQQLYERLAQGDGAALARLSLPDPALDDGPAAGRPPFKGLQHFEPADADLFFGRAALTARLVDHLRKHDLLIVVGASGSGKSSLVRAGLLPVLQGGDQFAARDRSWQSVRPWDCRLITPTNHPLQALALTLTQDTGSLARAAQLADDLAADARCLRLHATQRSLATGNARPGHLLLVVDQFEEVFTLCTSEAERAAFVANLLEAAPPDGGSAGPLTLVIALRADFYPQCAAYPALRLALENAQQYIGGMTEDELRQAITGPAVAGGWEIEPGLVDLLVRDAGSEPGALPLLSHALLETWRGRSGRQLTLRGYAHAGGVSGAIARTADTVYAQLDAEEQAIARRIFLRLTSLGDGMYETRRRAALSELWPAADAQPQVESVLRTLAAARLVTLSEGQVEVAHEALIREWPVLRRWLTEDRESIRLHHRLAEAVEAWEAAGEEPAELYRGARLAQATEWAQTHPAELSRSEAAFLMASGDAAQRETAERWAAEQRELATARDHADEQHRAAVRLRRLALVLAATLVLALALAGLAVRFSNQARRAAQEAQSQRSLAFSRELAASSMASLQDDPELGVILAIRAADAARGSGLPPPAEVEKALYAALQEHRLEARFTSAAPLEFSPDGTLVATPGSDGNLQVWDTTAFEGRATGDARPRLTLAPATAFVFSRDGKQLAWSDAGGHITLSDVARGASVRTLAGNPGGVSLLSFSADSSRLVSYGSDLTARVWSLTTGEALGTFSRAPIGLSEAMLTADGSYLVVRPFDQGTYVLDAGTGARVRYIMYDPSWEAAECGEAGILAVGAGPSVRTFDATTGASALQLNVLDKDLTALVCSPDGKRLATGGPGRAMRVWDLATGQLLLTLNGRGGNQRLAFTADGGRLIAYQLEGAEIWDVSAGRSYRSLPVSSGSSNVAVSPDGALLATGAGDEGAILVWRIPPGSGPDATELSEWDATASAPRLRLLGHRSRVTWLAFNPAGRRLASGDRDGQVLLWELPADLDAAPPTVTTSAPLPPMAAAVDDLAFSPDGARLAVIAGGTLRVWEPGVGPDLAPRLTYRPEGDGYETAPLALAWSPGGGQLALALGSGAAQVIDAATGSVLATLESTATLDQMLDLAYSPDGTRIATATGDRIARIWVAPKQAEPGTAEVLLTLAGHTDAVSSIAFSPDGARIATGDLEGGIRLWDATEGYAIISFPGDGHEVRGLTFSPDGAFLIASGESVRLYPMRVDDLTMLARSRVTRDLTPEETQRYLHVDAGQAAAPATVSAAPATAPMPPRTGEAQEAQSPAAVPGPQAIVQAWIDAWAHGASADVVNLFADKLDYHIVLDTTSRAALAWFQEYWLATNGKMTLVGCDPPQGDTIRCDLVYASDCERLTGFGPWHLSTSFTVRHGLIEKAAVTKWGPGEPAQLAELNRTVFEWAPDHAPDIYARLRAEETSGKAEPRLMGELTRELCAAYGASRTPPILPTPTR